MVREYKIKRKEKRATINLGKKGELFRDLFEEKCRGMSVTEFFRDAVLTMHSSNPDFKQRKIAFLSHKLIMVVNDIRLRVDEKEKIIKQLEDAGVSEEEIYKIYGDFS